MLYSLGESVGCSFLETKIGREYIPVFKAIRVQHILNDAVSVKTLELNAIIPEGEAIMSECQIRK